MTFLNPDIVMCSYISSLSRKKKIEGNRCRQQGVLQFKVIISNRFHYCCGLCVSSLVPFIIVHSNAAPNDLLELRDFDFVETVRFDSL